MAFFGPQSLGGLPLAGGSNDPITQAILARFPQLRGGQQAPATLVDLGYTSLGPNLGQGQQGPSSLSFFEGAKGVPESITAGLALGGYGKSASQQPVAQAGTLTQLGGLPAFPSPSLADIGQISGTSFETAGPTTGAEGGGSLDVGALLDAGGQAYNFLTGGAGGGQAFDPTSQTQSPAYQQQRAIERDYSWATGSPAGIPQYPAFAAPVVPGAEGGPGAFGGAIAQEGGAQGLRTLGQMTGTPDISLTQQFGQAGNLLTPDQEVIQSLLGAGLNSDEIANLIGQGSQARALGELGINTDLAAGEIAGISQQMLSPETSSALQNFLQGGVFEGGLGGFLQQGEGGLGGNLGLFSGAQAGLQGITGLMGVIQGIQSGNIPQTAGSALSTGQAAALLLNYPQLASALGIAASPLAIYSAVQDPSVQNILGAALTTYSTLSSIAPSTFTPLSTLGGQALSALSPGLASALGIGGAAAGNLAALASPAVSAALGITPGVLGTAGSAGSFVAPALSAAGVWAGPVAMIVQAVMDSIAEMERQRVQNAGFANNPIKGALYSAATAGVANANQILEQIMQDGDLSRVPIGALGNALSTSVNNLLPYYATAQGGRGAIRASDTITGRGPDWASKPYMGGQTPEEYTANFTQARGGVANLVNELMGRGVTYEQLGQLPISGDWSGISLDAGGTPDVFYAGGRGKYDAERDALLGRAGQYGTYVPEMIETGSGETAGWMTPTGNQTWQSFLSRGAQTDAAGNVTYPSQYGYGSQLQPDLLGAALGSSMIAPADVSNASGLMTGMYGGPMWAALARMGAPEFTGLIQEHFDPWVNLRNFDPQQLVGALSRDNPALRDLGAGQFMQGYTAPTAPPSTPAAPYWQDMQQQAQDYAQQQAISRDPALQAYQQQLADYQRQVEAWQQQALNPQITLPSVQAPLVSAGVPSMAPAMAPATLTGGGLTAEQLDWLRSQGWLG